MNLNEVFPHQVCINLDKRPDRWERVQGRFVENRLDRVVRFPALDGANLDIPSSWQSFPGAYGCLRSHLAVVEEARRKALPSVLIFEDDVVLAPDFNARFAACIEQVPPDWDMLFFGAIHGQPLTKVADNVIRVTHSLSTYAYAINHTIYDGFIETNRKATSVLDENTRALQKRFNCYCFMPHLAWVEEDYSDVREERINLWWLKESFVLYGSEIDEILGNTALVISYRNCNQSSFRNLSFIVDYFFQTLPNIAVVVLEQGAEPSLKHGDLPGNCRLEYLEDAGSNQRSRIMKRGFEMFGSCKAFFVFLDSDVFLTKEEMKANLLKLREYDFATSFCEIWDLNEAQTLRLLDGDLRWNCNGAFPFPRQELSCDSNCIITQHGLSKLAANLDGQDDCMLPARVAELLRVYLSPNVARRLSSA
jgi:glycosyl transferase family 25